MKRSVGLQKNCWRGIPKFRAPQKSVGQFILCTSKHRSPDFEALKLRMCRSGEQIKKCLVTLGYPTNPFTILELQNPSHDIPELHKIRRSPDREALKL